MFKTFKNWEKLNNIDYSWTKLSKVKQILTNFNKVVEKVWEKAGKNLEKLNKVE